MYNKQIISSVIKSYYHKHNCKFAFCESCYWFATILVDKFNNGNRCYICKKKDIHIGTILF
jgi:hypothetical protein